MESDFSTRKKMKKKITTCLALLLGFTVLFSSCSTQKQDEPTTSEPAKEENAESVEDNTDEETPTDEKETEEDTDPVDDETAAINAIKGYYDLYITGDLESAKASGYTDSQIESSLSIYTNSMKSSLRSSFESNGLTVEEEDLERICTARVAALNKLSAEFDIIDKTDEKISIKITTTYFDEAALDMAAANIALEAINAEDYSVQEEYMSALTNEYINQLIASYDTMVPSEDTKELEASCSKSFNQWLPNDVGTFASDLGLTVSGQK